MKKSKSKDGISGGDFSKFVFGAFVVGMFFIPLTSKVKNFFFGPKEYACYEHSTLNGVFARVRTIDDGKVTYDFVDVDYSTGLKYQQDRVRDLSEFKDNYKDEDTNCSAFLVARRLVDAQDALKQSNDEIEKLTKKRK